MKGTDMTLAKAIKLALEAMKAADKAVDAMKVAGAAFSELTERGAKKKAAAEIAAVRGCSPKTAENFISACIKAFETNADTVRAAHSVKPEKKAPEKKRFAVKAQADKTIARLGESNAEKLALEILKRQGYVFES